MSNKSNLFKRSSGVLFEPKFTRGKPNSTAYIGKQGRQTGYDMSNLANTNLASTSSFRYGDKDYLVSTQQVKTDFSRFENHTFFHSAVANVNEAFDRIVNFYPFEGTKKNIEEFEDTLTGFEKHVLDNFPKNVGYLNFSGTQPGESIDNGTYIEVLDRSGAKINAISDRIDGRKVLDPFTSSFSFEFWINPASIPNDNQIVLQKYSSLSHNFTLALSQSDSSSDCNLHFSISSGSNYLNVNGKVDKGEFSHVAAMYDRFNTGRLKLLINDNIFTSSNQQILGSIDYQASSLYIGKGNNARHVLNTSVFNVQESFSGSLDDLKFFHKVNTIDDIKKNKFKSFYPSKIDDTLIKTQFYFQLTQQLTR
jgi:hypothetical protein